MGLVSEVSEVVTIPPTEPPLEPLLATELLVKLLRLQHSLDMELHVKLLQLQHSLAMELPARQLRPVRQCMRRSAPPSTRRSARLSTTTSVP